LACFSSNLQEKHPYVELGLLEKLPILLKTEEKSKKQLYRKQGSSFANKMKNMMGS
jgi:hypothetical protein